jgi:hypothetical protein
VPSVTIRLAAARCAWYSAIRALGVLASTARLRVIGDITARLASDRVRILIGSESLGVLGDWPPMFVSVDNPRGPSCCQVP